ncbi:hypothetical protein PENANT_c108G08999 [Penicillium antarcticum]|uniref:Uncharacterized protein n=1 Tax=Penicillium antarcticum TaxID=416450 RepID=A0A1V6PL05_9EURO|nr:hypothetical protein PENANT_c108G08999 [Penicillium antarcticum]
MSCDFIMPGQPLWQTAKPIINSLRKLIEEGRAVRFKEDAMGWQYVGEEIFGEMSKLKTDVEAKGYTVHEFTVFHFIAGRNLSTPTSRLLLLPISGASDITNGITPGGPLELESYWDIDDKRDLIPRDRSGADVVVVAIH